MSDLAKEVARTVVRIKTEMRKASFASRSEAGRYAANQRWKGQGKKAKTPLDDLSIRGMTPEKMALDELRAHVEEQRGLLDAMQGVASKAEIKEQIRLVNLAELDLRRMEREQAKAEPPKSTHRASYLEYRVTNKQGRDKVFSEANVIKAAKGLNEKYGAPLATKDDVAFAAQIKDDLEKAIAPLEKEVRDVLGKLDANEGDRATNLKSLQRVKTKFAALARKSEKDAKASGDYANALEENTIRTMITRTRTQIFDMASKDVGFVLDQEKAIDKGLQSRMSKGKSFASRSEAGRYAANMRWKGQGAANTASGRASDGGYANTTGAAADGERQPEDKFDLTRVGGTALYLMSYGPGQIRRDAAGYHATDKNNISLFGRQELEGERTASTPPKTLAEAKRLIERWDAGGQETLVQGGGSTSSKSPALVDRLRDIVDNNVNDNGDSIDDLNRRYWEDDEYIPFEDLPKGGFREQVIAAFIDAKAAGYYEEPGRSRGPYDRPSSKMTDKGYAKARAHALKGNIDNSPSDLDEYWDDNSSIFWDEYAMITDQYPKDE